MRDTIAFGALAGIVGAVSMTMFELLAQSMGLIQGTSIQAAASPFVSTGEINSSVGVIIGIATHLFIGAIGGVLIFFIIKQFGRDYYLVKGLTIAAMFFLVLEGIISKLLNLASPSMGGSISALVILGSHIVYGLVTASVIGLYNKWPVNSR